MEENESPQTGINRRQLLKRGAIVGGALVWATPVVQSLGGTALAATSSPGGYAPSWTAIVLNCGGTYYLVKFDQSGKKTCGSDTGLPNPSASGVDGVCKLDAQLPAGMTVANDLVGTSTCPVGVSATVTTSGLSITWTDCTFVAWTVHDGAGLGCGQVNFGPDDVSSTGYDPTIGTGTALFPKPAPPTVTQCPAACSLPS